MNLGAICIKTRVECMRVSWRKIKKKKHVQKQKPEEYHNIIDEQRKSVSKSISL